MPRCASVRRHQRIRAIAAYAATCASACTGITAGRLQRGHRLTKVAPSLVQTSAAVRTGAADRSEDHAVLGLDAEIGPPETGHQTRLRMVCAAAGLDGRGEWEARPHRTYDRC